MPEEKGVFVSLSDFSFKEVVTRQIIGWLYGIALLAGGISVVVLVFNGLQQSPAQGLLALVFGLVCLFVWILYARVALELVIALFQIADNTARMAGGRTP